MGLHVRKRGDWVGNCPQCGNAFPDWPICKYDGFPLDGRGYRRGRRNKKWGVTQVTINAGRGRVEETMTMRVRDRMAAKVAGAAAALLMILIGMADAVNPPILELLDCRRGQKTTYSMVEIPAVKGPFRSCPEPHQDSGVVARPKRGFGRLSLGTRTMEWFA